MKYLLFAILAGGVASGALVVSHQTVPEPPVSPPPVADPQPPSPESEQAPERSQEDELEPFTPSEKVPADSAISFPVDI